jgi:hypothetical protein
MVDVAIPRGGRVGPRPPLSLSGPRARALLSLSTIFVHRGGRHITLLRHWLSSSGPHATSSVWLPLH